MTSIWKDLLAALMMGMVLPGLMLNYAVMGLRQEKAIPEIQITIPEETHPETVHLPVLLRTSDGTVTEAEMDPYLVGVVLAEMPASFESEALKAQAVAARTFARKAWETGGKHEDGSVCMESGCCQAYIAPDVYLEKGGTEEGLARIRKAVLDTSGMCIQYEGTLIEATYFSCSGGSTEDAAAVWGTEYPYLQSVDSPGEENARWYTDTVTFTPEQFWQKLNRNPEALPENWLGEVCYTEGNGVETIIIGGESYTGTQLRSLLGLRSTAFEIAASDQEIIISTKGYGHRVGMSQYGAEAMAVNGSGFEEILAHYYPGTELVAVS